MNVQRKILILAVHLEQIMDYAKTQMDLTSVVVNLDTKVMELLAELDAQVE